MNPRSTHFYEFGPFRLDPSDRLLFRGREVLPLTPKAYETLLLLIENHGHVTEKNTLMEKLWPDAFVEEGALSQNVSLLRKTLGESPDMPRYIETIPRRGYRFVAEVREVKNGDSIPALEEYSEAPVIGEVGDDPKGENGNTSSVIRLRKHWGGQDFEIAGGKAAGQSRFRGWRTWLAVTLAVLATLIALTILYATRPIPPPRVLSTVHLTNVGHQKLVGFPFLAPLVTDGSRIYFYHMQNGVLGLGQVSAAGGETVPIPSPLGNTPLLDIAPNRNELLAMQIEGCDTGWLWILPLLGGAPRRLTDRLALAGSWSPDGQRILYSSGYDLYLVSNDGSESRKLMTTPGIAYWLRWSPDGRVVRFTLYDPGTNLYSLWEALADGTHLRPLLPGWNNPPDECCGNWTPDGKYFVFQSRRQGVSNIWAIREKRGLFRKSSSAPVQLTTGPMNVYTPVSSPDGRRLFVVGGASPRGELVRYNSRSHQFVPYLSGISAEHLNFSKDGEWVTYVTYPEATLWRSKLDGSQRLQLSFPPMRAMLPQWSPDGKQIAFVGTSPGKSWKIYLVSAEGNTPQQLIPGEHNNEVDLNWSPDGKSIIFGGLEGPKGAIFKVDIRTHQVSTLPGSKGLFYPVSSADGHYLAAVSANGRVLVFDVSTQNWIELTKAPSVSYMAWSRDGKHLYFDGGPPDDPAIFRVELHDRKQERVLSMKNIQREWGNWYQWFGLAPDDSPLLLNSLGSQEIYALDWEAP
jgi:Tol biopolymer transport system component/DNA-binding winged helix-turn-helix (wHTH) protein